MIHRERENARMRTGKRKNQTNWNDRKRTKVGCILMAEKGQRLKKDSSQPCYNEWL